jgi:hypothetical protein
VTDDVVTGDGGASRLGRRVDRQAGEGAETVGVGQAGEVDRGLDALERVGP